MQCLIWSFEHDAWWGPNETGYTDDWDAAGRYSQEDAERICKKANNLGTDTFQELNETYIPQHAISQYREAGAKHAR